MRNRVTNSSESNQDAPIRSSWRDVLEIHPAAAVFPRIDQEKLAELARDIEVNGLQNEIVIFRDARTDREYLIDGISRLTALENNGVELVWKGKLDKTLGQPIGDWGLRTIHTSSPQA
jgi:hypothetical protein